MKGTICLLKKNENPSILKNTGKDPEVSSLKAERYFCSCKNGNPQFPLIFYSIGSLLHHGWGRFKGLYVPGIHAFILMFEKNPWTCTFVCVRTI